MVLLRPVHVHRAVPHALECALHAERADIDVAEHGGDEEKRDRAVHDLRDLHIRDVGAAVEGEHQHVAARRHKAAAEHYDPIDRLLAGIEAIGMGVTVADDATTFLHPLHVDLVGNVACDPHEEDQHHAQREGEAQEVVRILRPLRPGRKGVGTKQRDQQRPAEGDVEASQREHDEAARGHPVHQPLEGVETLQHPSRAPGFDLHHPAVQIEEDEQGQHADDCDGADPTQRHLVEVPPLAAGGLNDRAGLLVGDRAATRDPVELLKQLPLCHRTRSRVD